MRWTLPAAVMAAKRICCVVGAGLLLAPAGYAATLDTAGNNGATWLIQQRNVVDGSWGSADADKYVRTSEAVIALGGLNKVTVAYQGGVAWLGNHAPGNVDFAARRILALGTANHAVAADLALLQVAQALAVPGNSGWGLTKSYQGSALDTALSLQALSQQGVTANVAAAVAYLTGSQLGGTDSGWALAQESVSDPVTTAQAVIALVPLKSVSTAVPTAVTKGLAALNAKVTTTSATRQIALAIVANLRNDPSSPQATTLLNTLLSRQAADGSWGADVYDTALALRAVAAAAGQDLAAQRQVVNLPDEALRAAINAALGNAALDPLTVGQLKRLTSLSAFGVGIADLTGLQDATNLAYLDVRDNNIATFTPIAGLNIPTLLATGNPGYVPPTIPFNDADVPTLPEWGAIILACFLLVTAMRTPRRSSRRI